MSTHHLLCETEQEFGTTKQPSTLTRYAGQVISCNCADVVRYSLSVRFFTFERVNTDADKN